ncbi:lysylphosphatidylglycerol synthase transmembrane domain-containing protein [Thermoanaerobacterium thermosaccharolyticum]|uniref:lysylphosphatidylglycerol synthase transmembrane domain-containing protein n=1 Tax=Thermoanaerobacterium thermosaccharolyticum TaxID=1517 RepID=UPI003DA9B393
MNHILERKNFYMMAIAFVLSFGAIAIIMKFSGYQGLKDVMNINPIYIGIMLLFIFLSLLVDTYRIRDLLFALGEDLSVGYLFKFNLATFFFSYITPFGSGALPITIYLLNKKKIPPNKSLMIFTAKILFSGIFFGTIPPILLIFFSKQLELTHALSIFAILVSFILLFLLISLVYIILRPGFIIALVNLIANLRFFSGERYKRFFENTKTEIVEYNRRFNELFMVSSGGRLLISQLLYAMLFWTLFYSIAPILMIAMNIKFNLLAVISRQIIFYDLLAYNVIPSGAGFVEVGFASIFSNIIPHHLLGVFIGIWRFFTYYVYLIASGIGFFLIMKKDTEKPVNG